VPKAKQRPWFTWYQLSGAPFLILSDADRDLLLRDFASLLATVKHGVLLVRRRLDKFVYRDYAFNVTHYDFYLGAKGSREVFFFNVKRVDNIDRPRVKGSAGVKTLVLEDGFMWLLASQLSVNMGNCTSHGTATPLLNALCDMCGSEAERVRILHNITSYSLNALIRNISLYYPSYNTTAINATVCIARISNYPELWNLNNTSIDHLYALPADNGYLVLYNIYENSPFGDWRRVKQWRGIANLSS